MRYKLTTEDMVILRDGRPFGDAGQFGGNSYIWPLPQSILGMVRTTLGFNRGDRYFENDENIKTLLTVGISNLMPSMKTGEEWKPLMPVPSDLVFTDSENENHLTVHPLVYATVPPHSGTDMTNKEWLIPSTDLKEKPSKNKPFLMFYDFFLRYLDDDPDLKATFDFSTIGIETPVRETRMHNAIDSASYSTQESKLFSNTGTYFRCRHGNTVSELSLDFDVTGEAPEDISGMTYLGGERKRVLLSTPATPFPDMPDIFTDKKFLKLVLMTHGNFGGFCPDWICADLDKPSTRWVQVPGTSFEVRLRSACVHGWDGVSGWDYEKKEPKAMKKLVRPGSVYVIELKNGSDSLEVARTFWGRSINPGTANNGYGQCVVGNVTVTGTF